MPSPPLRALVLGAGVIGLTTAIELQRTLGASVTILASAMPEDLKSIAYTSSWAGAHCVTLVGPGLKRDIEEETFKRMWELAHQTDPDVEPAPLAVLFDTTLFTDQEGMEQAYENVKDWMPDCETIPPGDIPATSGCTRGYRMRTVFIDTPNYLLWLSKQFTSAGGQFLRQRLTHIKDAPIREVDLLVNCTGLGSYTLGGVADTSMYPVRGQTILVRAPWLKFGISRALTPEKITYIIPRLSGDVIVGGTREEGDWHGEPRPETAEVILARALRICPELLPADKRDRLDINDLDIVEHGCGFRPGRKDGVRIEREDLEVNGRSVPLVHCYGHDGAGYQMSWGSARRVVDIAKTAMRTKS